MSGRRGPKSMVTHGWSPGTGQWDDESPAGRVLRSLKVGNFIEASAEWAGISAAAVHKWLRKGRELMPRNREGGLLEEFDREKIDEDDRPFVDFFVAVAQAEAHAEVELVTLWRSAAKDDWKAAMHLLSRRQPSRWKEQIAHQVTGADGGPVVVATQTLDMAKLIASDPEARRLSSQLLARLAGATPPDVTQEDLDDDEAVPIGDVLAREIDPENATNTTSTTRPPADPWPDDEEDDARTPDP